MTKKQKELLIALFDCGAVLFGSFKFKHHEEFPDLPLSPNKFILRVPDNGGALTPELVEAIGREIFLAVQKSGIQFDLIAGLPRAGDPFAEVVARLSSKPLLKFGKKEEGGRRKIDSVVSGEYSPGQRILLVDDVITWGNSKREGIEVSEDHGLVVAAIALLIDREEGGSIQLEKNGYLIRFVFRASEVFKLYLREGKISREQYERSLAFSRALREKAEGLKK
jgi:uridine monophosphate synthetase